MTLEATLAVTVEDRTATFTFEARNVGSEPIELCFRDAGVVEVVVADGDRDVWRYTEGRLFAQVIDERRLDPGEILTEAVSWHDPVPGSYTAEAELRDRSRSCRARAEFEIRDGDGPIGSENHRSE